MQEENISSKTASTSGCSIKSKTITVKELLKILNNFDGDYEVYVKAECACNANSTTPHFKGSVKIKAVIQVEEGCKD